MNSPNDFTIETLNNCSLLNRTIYCSHRGNPFDKRVNVKSLSDMPNCHIKEKIGKSILMNCVSGNIGHLYVDWLYPTYVCATRVVPDFENLLLYHRNSKFEKILVNSFEKNFFSSKKINYLDENLFIENLSFPVFNRKLYRENEKTLWSEIKKNLITNFDIKHSDNKRKKIVIHNDHSRGRKILNISALIEKLSKQYDVLYLDGDNWFKNQTLEEIIQVYSTADVYISPWGASFFDCIFSKPSCKIIMLKASILKGEAWYFSGQDSLKYLYENEFKQEFNLVSCEYEKWEDFKEDGPGFLSFERTANLKVNIDEIENIIK
jgi:capsular polysaccharide biosynthesis protein